MSLSEAFASRNGIRCLLLAAMALLQAGCGTLYVVHAARGQWQVMRERRPIAEVLEDPSTPAALRDKLETVRAAREFASRELALPDNGSYRTYADVRRPYVVWNVVAAPEFSVTPRRWCFPIAGCVAYRGYFSEPKARAFAARLERDGLDVAVGGVAAYSTLGRLDDPVLSTMVAFGDEDLAAILFHELSHQVVYVPGDSEFNEAFAVTVEQAGVARWLAARGAPDALDRYRQRRVRQLDHLRAFARAREALAVLYERDLTVPEMRERKEALLARLEEELRAMAREHGIRSPYAAWLEAGLNNAHLASIATYFECVPGFERLLERAGGELPAFYDAVRELARLPRAERRLRVCVGAAGPQPARRDGGNERRWTDSQAGAAVVATDAVDRE